jgi:tRNA (cmo5U34)-methyltransferase
MTKHMKDFSFEDHVAAFDRHIGQSIPGYEKILLPECVRQSRRFIQAATDVYDVGCSTGRLLKKIRAENRKARARVTYIGIDCEPAFQSRWPKQKDLQFVLGDAVDYPYENASLVIDLFTTQFVREADKRRLLKRIHDGLVDGGALIMAEKVYAETGRMQDAMQSTYYEFKRLKFTAEQILDKEQRLRGLMTCWTESELWHALRAAGFREMNPIFRAGFFVAYLALK